MKMKQVISSDTESQFNEALKEISSEKAEALLWETAMLF